MGHRMGWRQIQGLSNPFQTASFLLLRVIPHFSLNLHLLIILFPLQNFYIPCIYPELTNSCSLMAGLHLHPLRILYVLRMAACSRLCKSFKIRSNLLCWVFFFLCVKISKFIVLDSGISSLIFGSMGKILLLELP